MDRSISASGLSFFRMEHSTWISTNAKLQDTKSMRGKFNIAKNITLKQQMHWNGTVSIHGILLSDDTLPEQK
jgi:hypothetical protein